MQYCPNNIRHGFNDVRYGQNNTRYGHNDIPYKAVTYNESYNIVTMTHDIVTMLLIHAKYPFVGLEIV